MIQKRALVIRFSSLGDIVLLTPLFREIKKEFPGIITDFLTSTTFADVCANNPNIDNLIALDRTLGKNELAKVVKECSQQKYDYIFDAHGSLRSRLFRSKCFGLFNSFHHNTALIDKRSWKRNLLLKFKINYLQQKTAQRRIYCQLLNQFGKTTPFDDSTELFPGPKEKNSVDELLKDLPHTSKKLIAIGPSASFKGKCWPWESFLQLSEVLSRLNYQILLLGGPNDQEPGWMAANTQETFLNLSGRLSYLESAELLSRCCLSVSNDSAVVHISEAMGTPAIAIFGPTVAEFGFAPYLDKSRLLETSLPCRPCSRNGKGKCTNKIQRQCLKDITVEHALSTSLSILNEPYSENSHRQ